MADFDLSAVIRGDASSLVSAAGQADASLDKLGKAQGDTARSADQLQAATAREERAIEAATLAANKLSQAQANVSRTSKEAARDMDRHAYGARNVGQQFGDLGLSIASGISPARAFGQQAGQLGFALSEMGGKAGAVGRFLVGPWGIALTVAAAVAAPFVEKLFEGGKAAEEQADKLAKAADAADSYGNAQSLLGKIIDLTTGKLKTQNAVLIQTIKLQAQANILAAQAEQKTASKALGDVAKPTMSEGVLDALRGVKRAFTSGDPGAFQPGASRAGEVSKERAAQLKPLNDALAEYVKIANTPGIEQGKLDKALDQTLARIDQLGKNGKLAGRELIDTKQKVIDLARTLNDQKANQLVLDAINGEGIAPELKPYERPRRTRTPKPKVDRATPAAIEAIADITAQFDDAPALIDRASDAMRKLDRIIADVAKRKPLNYEAIIADAERAKTVVEAALIRPYRDFIEGQQNALEVQRLITDGRADEAEAMQIIVRLEAQMGPLTQARKDAILATVQAIKAEQRETEIAREKAQSYLNALSDIKSAVRSVITDGANGIANLPKRLIAAFTNLRADIIMEKLFGEAFRDLQDRASGVSIVKDASQKMATSIEGTLPPLANLASAAADAAASLGKVGPSGAPTSKDDPLGIAGSIADALAQEAAGKTPGIGDGEKDIVVQGSRIPRDPAGFFSYTIEKLSKGVLGDEAARKIGNVAGKAVGGAATGALVNSFVAPLGKALGVKTSNTGAQIGGAIGSFLPIPGGDIIGSIVGSVVGGLFKKTPRASATITSVEDTGTVTGSSNKLRQQATGLATGVQDGLQQIADALGGTLGSFAVSIGTRNGKFRVDPSGRGATKTSKGAVDFGEDEGAATSFAIQNAITDGAVQGLSAAVQQAIRSNSNIDKALREALKVQQVEDLIGGLGSTLKRTFSDFDKEAADRVRIAKRYGLDVVKIEQVNAEQRAKLVDDALKARVGSLKDFLDSVQFGDLSEGTISEKRDKLLAQRSQLEADALAGKDGAADKLASISSQLIQLTREGFGTAGGELRSDRATTVSGVERVIAMENQRVADAAAQQQATTAAVETNNALTNETNQLLAIMNTNLMNLAPAQLAGIALGGRGSFLTERATALK